MLNNLSNGIRECLERAEECARRAAARPAGSPTRLDYLQLEGRWLARSIEFSDQLEDFARAHPKPGVRAGVFLRGRASSRTQAQSQQRSERAIRPGHLDAPAIPAFNRLQLRHDERPPFRGALQQSLLRRPAANPPLAVSVGYKSSAFWNCIYQTNNKQIPNKKQTNRPSL